MLSPATYPDWLSDWVGYYFRKCDHRGQLRVLKVIESLLGRRRWNVRTNYGFRIGVDRNDLLQWAILKNGNWDPEVAESLAERWTPADVFYDVGANIGYFSLLALTHNLRMTVAFEPFDELTHLLARNLGKNGFDKSRYRVEQLALGARSQIQSYVPGDLENSGAGRLNRAGEKGTATVNVASLDDYLETSATPAPTIMKLDVEGFELEVLEGARKLLATAPPHTIVFEADCDSRFNIIDPSISDLLIDKGYEITHLAREVSESKENFLAIHPLKKTPFNRV